MLVNASILPSHPIKQLKILVGTLLISLTFSGCKTFDQVALRSSTQILEGQYQSFLSEEDPQLAREAAAGNVKLVEGMLIQDPENPKLQTLAAKVFFSYAFSYVKEEDTLRAGRLYLRGLKAGAGVLGGETLFLTQSVEDFQKMCEQKLPESLESLFWCTLNFASWADLNKSDLKALNNQEKVKIAGETLKSHDPHYYYGGPDLLIALYHLSKPASLGGEPEKGREHFDRSLQIGERKFLPTLYFYAKSYAVAVQNKELFKNLLNEIIDFNVDSFPEQRLANLITQAKAQSLLKNREDLFI